MKLNLPNKLTVLRMFLVPVCMFFMMFEGMNETAARLIAAGLFALTSLTDMLDGKIARKYNLITDFGKFLDPVADKLLIIGSLIGIMFRYRADTVFAAVVACCLFVIVVREISVTSLRMIVASNVVVPANIFGKLKTVSQIICVLVILVEPVIFGADARALSYVTLIFCTVMTIFSGATYFKAYFKYINPGK